MIRRICFSLVFALPLAAGAGCATAPVPPAHSATPIIESDAPPPAAAAVHVSASTETPSTEAPSTETPSTEAPSTETPSTETPSTETPSTETPSTEAPSTETPSTEAPSTEAPSTETPSTEATDGATAEPPHRAERAAEPEPATEPESGPATHPGAPESGAADATPGPENDAIPAPPWDPDAPVVFAPAVEAHVRAIARRVPRRDDAAFVKVGDSATVSRIYLRCLGDDGSIRFDGRGELQPILERFRGGAGGDPFARESLAAGVGWSANRPLRGSPTPLAREVRAMNPRFALVMFGSNDLELGRLGRYESRMTALVDRLLGWGVVPVLSTIPQRNDDAEADRDVPRYNRVVRALARARRLPLIDLNRALAALPDRGLASDGVHPSAPVVDGRAHGCDFTEAGLQHGMNVRNLLTLRVLGRLVEVVSEEPDAP